MSMGKCQCFTFDCEICKKNAYQIKIRSEEKNTLNVGSEITMKL